MFVTGCSRGCCTEKSCSGIKKQHEIMVVFFSVDPIPFSLVESVEENLTFLCGGTSCFREHCQEDVVFGDEIQEEDCMKFLHYPS